MNCCANCGREDKTFFKTAYGPWLCEDCWDDYLMTDNGKVEYLIGICNGDYPMSNFDADFLGEVAMSWRRFIMSLDYTDEELSEFEKIAISLGLL